MEFSLLLDRLRDALPPGGPLPGLVALTELLRDRVTRDLEGLLAGLARTAAVAGGSPIDRAMLSGVLVHGPDGADAVVLREAWVQIDDDRRTLPFA